MPPQVMLTSRLSCYPQPIGDLWPADAKSHSAVGQHSQFGVQLFPLQSCPANPLQHLGRGKPGYPLGRARWRRRSPHPVIRAWLDSLGQSPPPSAHAASVCRSSSAWPRSSVAGGDASCIPRSAATRRHLSSLHLGDAAACRFPQSQASALGVHERAPSLRWKERGRSGQPRSPTVT